MCAEINELYLKKEDEDENLDDLLNFLFSPIENTCGKGTYNPQINKAVETDSIQIPAEQQPTVKIKPIVIYKQPKFSLTIRNSKNAIKIDNINRLKKVSISKKEEICKKTAQTHLKFLQNKHVSTMREIKKILPSKQVVVKEPKAAVEMKAASTTRLVVLRSKNVKIPPKKINILEEAMIKSGLYLNKNNAIRNVKTKYVLASTPKRLIMQLK